MNDLINKIETSFKTQFPKGYCRIRQSKGLSGEQITISIGLVNDINIVTAKIRENDPMFHKFLISLDGETLESTLIQGSLAVKPIDQFYVMNHVKTGFRKTTGDANKVVKTYDKFFAKLKTLVNEQGNNIYKSEQYIDFLP